ncbi:hypothetical protein [Stenotrophomonas sp.]|uniref:hypothetical protein n=1 Tax=Stenotrophomonas sp. TaxID=69392 RepID=UPI0028A5C939|nr:hypothetical protein [Stenotrophomonas sp.]
MDRYFVNQIAQDNGDHEVHKLGCYWLGLARSTQDLGLHVSCASAVRAAGVNYRRANGCVFCAMACHTS